MSPVYLNKAGAFCLSIIHTQKLFCGSEMVLNMFGGGEMNWEIGIAIYALLYIKQITNENLHRGVYSVFCGDLKRKKIQKRGDICTCAADS